MCFRGLLSGTEIAKIIHKKTLKDDCNSKGFYGITNEGYLKNFLEVVEDISIEILGRVLGDFLRKPWANIWELSGGLFFKVLGGITETYNSRKNNLEKFLEKRLNEILYKSSEYSSEKK